MEKNVYLGLGFQWDGVHDGGDSIPACGRHCGYDGKLRAHISKEGSRENNCKFNSQSLRSVTGLHLLTSPKQHQLRGLPAHAHKPVAITD